MATKAKKVPAARKRPAMGPASDMDDDAEHRFHHDRLIEAIRARVHSDVTQSAAALDRAGTFVSDTLTRFAKLSLREQQAVMMLFENACDGVIESLED